MDIELLILMLLQTSNLDTLSSVAVSSPPAAEAPAATIGLLDLLLKGGFMMIPLYLLFILAIFIFIQKLLVIKKASKTPRSPLGSSEGIGTNRSGRKSKNALHG
jgi:hypothetical protein